MSTITQTLAAAVAQGLPRLDAQMLLLHVLDRSPHDRAWLLAHDQDALLAEAGAVFETLCRRHLSGEPRAYLLGEQEFCGLRLRVDARVLVPRPDTETLVDWALECLRDQTAPPLLDLGTGSGAIALALAQARPDAQIDAVDASADALAVARANAQRLGLPVRFAQADWLTGAASGYALIASNPPYIAEHDSHLAALQHEPASALVAGADGLADMRRIIEAAPAHLAPGGWLLLEHGHDQAPAVRALLTARGLAQVQSRDDLTGTARCTGGIWLGVK